MTRLVYLFLCCFLGLSLSLSAAEKPIVKAPGYEHTKYSPSCTDFEKEYRAYTTCFDTKADDGEAWGIPDFVSYHMKKFTGPKIKAGRPSWFSEPSLVASGEAPEDKSYTYDESFRDHHPDWYSRGHLAMKAHANRLGADADYNTHTLLNALPQRQKMNAGPWLKLENETAKWADAEGEVWIIAGPVFLVGKPLSWIGEVDKGEMLVAVPDAFFKVVVMPGQKVKAYVFPQSNHTEVPDNSYDKYETTVSRVEALTGLTFKQEIASW